MKLEEIGFYTLSDERAKNASAASPLQRCELLITDQCNFNCLYCRKLKPELQGDMGDWDIRNTLNLWLDDGLRNIRISGGEPMTLIPVLHYIARSCAGRVDHIAISTNGSARLHEYEDLISLGVNDLSISLDGGCCAVGDKMSGSQGTWETVVSNIRELSKLTYVTVGMVFTEDNVEQAVDAVLFADSLGVSDIRVIPAAQYNRALFNLTTLPAEVLSKYPILSYRVNNLRNGRSVRGLETEDTHKCYLVLDDMAVVQNYHFPCIIYLREGGNPIGRVGEDMRQERLGWMENHNPVLAPICSAMCLDVCRDYNKKCEELR